MKRDWRGMLRRLLRTSEAVHRTEYLLTAVATGEHPRRNHGVDRAVQILLQMQYRELAASGRHLPTFDEVELRFMSQNGEDGILLFLFALLGTTTKRSVEICAGDGVECNTGNLIVNHGWQGLLVDGSESLLQRGGEFYKNGVETWFWPPRLERAWVTAETVNKLVTDAGFAGSIDLLSLDMDGVDYWVWKALDCIEPRVVVLEYNPALGPDLSYAIPYDPTFVLKTRVETGGHAWYSGASLAAYVKLAKTKGLRLVGAQRYGFNAFFVKEGLAEDLLPTVTPASCYTHPAAIKGAELFAPLLESLPWVSV
jgi:hypothetical protein